MSDERTAARRNSVLAAIGAGAVAVPVCVACAESFGAVAALTVFAVVFLAGALPGVAFGQRERDVAFPMPLATSIAAFGCALVLGVPAALVALAMMGHIGGP